MYSSQNKQKNKPASQSIKKQKPRPEWTTDFVDRQQFKLSQTQMIQKKAALQSKHRQEAKRQLQQRRKKLEMGIIDDQTRKVYQTALISKNIDINPPIRKNLTEMIRYEKQQKQKQTMNEQEYDQQNHDDQGGIDQYEKQLRQAQNFIKKFQRAKKQQKIQRAVEILSNNKSQIVEKEKRSNQGITQKSRINNFMNNGSSENLRSDNKSLKKKKGSQSSQSFSQDEALSSIEDTIKFMEQKLFAAKKTVEQHSKSFISQQNSINHSQFYQKKQRNKFSDDEDDQAINFLKNKEQIFKKHNQNRSKDQNKEYKFEKDENILQNVENDDELQFNERMAEISQLRIKLKDQDASSQDDECLNTIRRMREMMQNKESSDNQKNYSQRLKQNIRDNSLIPNMETMQWNSKIPKRNDNQSVLQSEAQVSFSLTNNNDDSYQQQGSQLNLSKSKIKNNNFVDEKVNFMIQQNNFLKPSTDFSNKQSKQEEYQDEYEKIKQNLFKCINSENQNESNKNESKRQNMFKKFQQDSDDEESQDSLMVRDKINLWKQELQHQVQPEEQDEQNQFNQNPNINININTKTTFMNSKHQFTRTTVINKMHEQNEDEQDDDSAYKYTYFQQNTQSNKFHPQQNISQFTNTNNSTNGLMMKKPPLAKKTQNSQKFQEMKKMMTNTTNQIQKIEIQPLKIQPLPGNTQMLGFDFRGSINIKKNILTK